MKIDLANLTIKKAHEALVKGDFTAVDLTKAYLESIKAQNKNMNAFREVFADAVDQAKEADKKIASALKADKSGASVPMLIGIPCAMKDNILIQGRIAGASSKILEDYHATYDATVIAKLRKEGVVFIGRTNMDEFAMGGSTENSAYGVTRNPHDTERVAGGSSGGSAAAVAMNGALFALGTDTGGSIRQPASFCGVVGFKPTYGAVSRYGAIAMGSSLDQIGPITKTAADAEIVFSAIRGEDLALHGGRGDGTAITVETYPHARVGKKKPIIGVPRHFLTGDGLDPAAMKAFDAALESFKKKGYEVKEVKLPNISYALMVYYIVMPAEVSSNLARFDGVKYGLHVDGGDVIQDYLKTRRAGLGKEVIRRILLGTYVLSSGYYDAYYNRANAVRALITNEFMKAFESIDLVATPTAPGPAFKVGEKASDPMSMYLEDIFTVTANITGMPAVSIPCGTTEKGGKILPLGLQLTARLGDEATLFEASKEFLGE